MSMFKKRFPGAGFEGIPAPSVCGTVLLLTTPLTYLRMPTMKAMFFQDHSVASQRLPWNLFCNLSRFKRYGLNFH